MKLSVIVIAFDMAREIPRTLQSLSRDYQHGAADLDYEVLLVDNGSPLPLDAASWAGIDVPVRLIALQDAPPSPAHAINCALRAARGDIVCLMIDGAHLLTPGVFRMALSAYRAFADAVVCIRYFYLGTEEQTVSIAKGYDKAAEDALLQRIAWPHDGYRLFEVSTPLRSGASRLTWFNRMFEANCLFMRKALFLQHGGANEQFDYPGGGFLNLDIYKKAVESSGVTPVQIIGEGSFHQLHGGITTNASGDDRAAQLQMYRRQYASICGHEEIVSQAMFTYMGHMPTTPSNISAVERRRARLAKRRID